MADRLTTTRRAVLTGVATASTAALPALPAAFAAELPSDDAALLERLWAERTKLAMNARATDRAYRDAEARLPEWAAPGPCYLHSDGTYSGPHVGWPRKDVNRLPEGIAMINIRPSPGDIRRDFELHVRIWGRRERKAAQAAYENRMAALSERVRQQDAERVKLDLPNIEARADGINEQLIELEGAIMAVSSVSPMKAAIMFMLGLTRGRAKDTLDDGADTKMIASGVLPFIRPRLRGLVAKHVDDLIAHPATPNGEREFWSGCPA